MPNTIKQDETSRIDWRSNNSPTVCATCPANLTISGDLNLPDYDLGESGDAKVNAHLETVTGTNGKKERRLVLS